MLRDPQILAAIDVGTTKVCTIIGRASPGGVVEILGFGIVPCDGLSKGNVRDIASTRNAIRKSVDIAERASGIQVTQAAIGVTGTHVTFQNRLDTLDWVGKIGVITADELEHVPEKIAANSRQSDRKVIHAIPVKYSLDGGFEIRDPLGMHTNRIQVETHLVTGAAEQIGKLVSAVESAGVSVADLVLEPLASAEAVLTQQEKNRGVALVDIGGGTTDIVVFRNGKVYYSGVIPIGGYQFTNDIVMSYNTNYEAAEQIKLEYAHALPDTVRPDEEVNVPVHDRAAGLKVARHEICQLTRERAQELTRLVSLKLRDAGVARSSRISLVLTGGASNMRGVKDIMQRYFAGHVRLGQPGIIGSLPDELRDPAYATSVGAFLWSATHSDYGTYHGQAQTANGTSAVSGVNGAKPANGHVAVATRRESERAVGRLLASVRKIF